MEVRWQGWRSDTLALQDNGWEIVVQEMPERNMIRIGLYHAEMKLYGFQSEYEHYTVREMDPLPPLVISHMAPRIDVISVPIPNFVKMLPIDAVPQISETFSRTIQSFSELALFRPLNQMKEIVVEPENVNTLLQRILELQSPRQAELREKARLEERRNKNVVNLDNFREVYNPKTDIIAQVISLG